MRVKIEWLSDDMECDTCGSNWAQGAKVWFDNDLVIDNEPIAACFDGADWSETDIYREIIAKLGHAVEED